MKIFFLQFSVKPTERNLNFEKVEGAYVSFWIRDQDRVSAFTKAKFDVSKYDWVIEEVTEEPHEVTEHDFIDKDLGLDNYHKALAEGRACVYVGWPKDGKKIEGELKIDSSQDFNLGGFLKKQKNLTNKGRCLHFNNGIRCNLIIKAHSIQKNGVLSKIARDGKVYQVSKNFSDLKRSNGNVAFQLEGVSRVSTFKGFCKYHDNKLFEPIDNLSLIPTSEQMFLYSYRSLCKELFVKENALDLLESQYEMHADSPAYSGLLSGMLRGTKHGYKNLCRHKALFDESLKTENYEEIKYMVFISDEPPFMAFSGVLYPEYDFMGNTLQDLSNEEELLDMITFCSAPITGGWAFIFAWHTSSSKNCINVMRSLATLIYEGHDVGDLLFRFVIASCENVAFSPKWWESLTKEEQKDISEKATIMAGVFTIVLPNYLQEGLSGISGWKFPDVYSEME